MATMRKMVLFEVKMHQTMMIKRCVMDLVLFRTHEEEFVAALSPGCLRSLQLENLNKTHSRTIWHLHMRRLRLMIVGPGHHPAENPDLLCELLCISALLWWNNCNITILDFRSARTSFPSPLSFPLSQSLNKINKQDIITSLHCIELSPSFWRCKKTWSCKC